MNGVLAEIRNNWSWIGVRPAEIVDVNRFGNVLFRADDGAYWRICPEELTCEIVAGSVEDFEALSRDARFQEDWQMHRLVAEAEERYGVQPPDRCYCLKIPAVLGGAYDIGNIGTISIAELVRFSGHVAEQIKDVPDGEQITFDWTE